MREPGWLAERPKSSGPDRRGRCAISRRGQAIHNQPRGKPAGVLFWSAVRSHRTRSPASGRPLRLTPLSTAGLRSSDGDRATGTRRCTRARADRRAGSCVARCGREPLSSARAPACTDDQGGARADRAGDRARAMAVPQRALRRRGIDASSRACRPDVSPHGVVGGPRPSSSACDPAGADAADQRQGMACWPRLGT